MNNSINSSIANKLYSSYEEALNFCNNIGYSKKVLTEVVVKKNLAIQKLFTSEILLDNEVSRTLLAISSFLNSHSLRILDFGGGGGYHYTIARHVLGNNCNIKWNVVETDAMCNSGKAIADKSLKFFNNIDDAASDLGHIDLVLSSSSLQYCPDPLVSLQELLNVSAKFIYITRTPFHSGKNNLISIQSSLLSHNGPGPLPEGYNDEEVFYPITFVPLSHVENLININYNFKFKIKEEPGNLFFNNEPLNTYYGLFCEIT